MAFVPQKFADGLIVRITKNQETGDPELIAKVLEYEGDGMYILQLTDEYVEDDPDGLIEVHEDQLQFLHQEGE